MRRALANIPTYMIFDDHDVSDDWNLNRAWCQRVYGNALGRQVVRNALLAYGLFQGWGNTPEQFKGGRSGEQLIALTERWAGSKGEDFQAIKDIYQRLGLPPLDQKNNPQFSSANEIEELERSEHSMQWHYRVESASHEVIVLDTRTRRGYPTNDDPEAIPYLISPKSFKQQLQTLLSAAPQDEIPLDKLTFVVAPTNVFSVKLLSTVQRWVKSLGLVFDMDVGDSWNLEESARERLLAHCFADRDRIIVLTGDIHFSAALRLQYQSNVDDPQPPKTLVQLTASALANTDTLTSLLHTKIKSLFPERERHWHEGKTHYSTQWVPRQPAIASPWGSYVPWLTQPLDTNSRDRQTNLLQRWLTRIWHSRWIQEGHEVVGLNNIGEVHLQQPNHSQEKGDHGPSNPRVIQTIYWYAPWNPGRIVCSQFLE